MTFSTHNTLTRPARFAGFTLVEVMIAAGLGSLILAGVLAAFLMLLRSGIRTSNYSAMETQTRMAFEQLGIDSRMASNILTQPYAGPFTSITLTIPHKNQVGSQYATYIYDTSSPTNKKLIVVYCDDPTKDEFSAAARALVSTTPGRRTLVDKISSMEFKRYDKSSVEIAASVARSDADVNHIQISLSLSRAAGGVATASQVIRSSAFTLRNK